MDVSNRSTSPQYPFRRQRPRWLRRRVYKPRSHERLEVTLDMRQVIDEMRQLWWGRIENLIIRNGMPVLTVATKTFRRTRRGEDSTAERAFTGSHPQPHELHQRFFKWCRGVGNGVIARVEIADGLPVSWTLVSRSRKRS